MIKYENGCVDCGLGGCATCRLNHTYPIYYCDKCGTEIDDEDYEEAELCEECYIKTYGENIDGQLKCEECWDYYNVEDTHKVSIYKDKLKQFVDYVYCNECYKELLKEFESEGKNNGINN